jgi:hypothetical protein
MTTKTPPDDWVLLEAARLSDTWCRSIEWLRNLHSVSGSFRALCDMIQKYEKPPVDRKLLCAREAISVAYGRNEEWIAVRAIELWEECFGYDHRGPTPNCD